jgi:NAD(P)-dependent dehydrogenase (short-subunit alcohol dehydrogenase family)
VSGALADKVAVVTGGGRGVGRAYAHALAGAGATVVVNDLPDREGDSPAETVVREIETAGGRAVAAHGSVAEFAGAGSVVAEAVRRFGRLDIVIANAGNVRPGQLHEIGERDWSDVLAVHATGTFNIVRHAAPVMIEGGGGSIITTGDLSTDLLFPRIGSYRAAKAAIAIFTLYSAEELREHNINVNSIMPGATDTRMMRAYFDSLGDKAEEFFANVRKRYENEGTSGTRPATPESVPPLGVYLCTDGARGITGRLFNLKHSTIRLFTPHGYVSSIHREDEELWTTAALSDAVPPWLDGMAAAAA